jgi:hypothetical protein
LRVLSDTFGIDKTVDIVEEELNKLAKRGWQTAQPPL